MRGIKQLDALQPRRAPPNQRRRHSAIHSRYATRIKAALGKIECLQHSKGCLKALKLHYPEIITWHEQKVAESTAASPFLFVYHPMCTQKVFLQVTITGTWINCLLKSEQTDQFMISDQIEDIFAQCIFNQNHFSCKKKSRDSNKTVTYLCKTS